ncbi:MAG TPA: AmmeMemoRadiSam system radical SAM enzyme [Pyrinomonadaceae bacterium]|jgi:pyruvate formate lyase activating enzyme
MPNWKETSHPARLEEILENGVVRCHLSPRNCTIKEGQHGFCGVRANRNGRLVSLNYGKSVHATEETIETEAVNHYAPGERILSMGNIGCMMNCSYCHNWKTSQARFVSDKDVYYYTPEGVVDMALRHGIRCISWTYNDPVVWHEFVRDTAAIAQKAGIINLYKSAFYITAEAVEELLPFMDIFSISIKSMDPEYYRKITKGQLEPVLEATKQVFKAGKHVELSTLMITDISDDEATARKIANWILTELDSTVPLHYVRFHPDYRMRDTTRTPIPRLIKAREAGLDMGMEHVYVGNVYDTPFSNTFCRGCETELVTRYGLNAVNVGLDQQGHCRKCGRDAHFKLMPPSQPVPTVEDIPREGLEVKAVDWHGDIRSAHAQVLNTGDVPTRIYHRRHYTDGQQEAWKVVTLDPQESYRFILAKGKENEVGAQVAMPSVVQSNLHEVFDRAHFPTLSIEEIGVAERDIAPLPLFEGGQHIVRLSGETQ